MSGDNRKAVQDFKRNIELPHRKGLSLNRSYRRTLFGCTRYEKADTRLGEFIVGLIRGQNRGA